jgi:transposase-like protein
LSFAEAARVSVAKVALTYGINSNLLHNWIALHRKEAIGRLSAPEPETSASTPAPFIPVMTTSMDDAEQLPRELRLDITLDNGIQADLRGVSRDDALAILPVLAGLPCSASTRR